MIEKDIELTVQKVVVIDTIANLPDTVDRQFIRYRCISNRGIGLDINNIRKNYAVAFKIGICY